MHGSYLPKKCCIICTKLQWPGAADASGVVQCITRAAVHGGHIEQFLSFPWPGCCCFFHFWTQTRSFPGTWHLHAQLPFGHFLSKKPWSIPNVTYAKSDYCCFLPGCFSLNVGVILDSSWCLCVCVCIYIKPPQALSPPHIIPESCDLHSTHPRTSTLLVSISISSHLEPRPLESSP